MSLQDVYGEVELNHQIGRTKGTQPSVAGEPLNLQEHACDYCMQRQSPTIYRARHGDPGWELGEVTPAGAHPTP